jgi:hypothetical protein
MNSDIWLTSISRKYDGVLDQMERAIRMCPDELWEASLWPVERHHPHVWPLRRAGDKSPGDEEAQAQLLPVVSAFWNIAYHAIFHVDFYLSRGVRKGFKPPPPFREADHWGHVVPVRTYTSDELLSYIEYDRERVRSVVGGLTDERVESIVPRFGVTFGEFLLRTLLHTQEHAAQLHLFLGQHSVEPRGGIAADQRRQYLREGVRGRSDAEIDAFVVSIGGYARLLPLVFAGFCAGLRPTEALVVQFEVGAAYIVRAKAGRAAIEKRARKNVDAVFRASAQDFLRLMTSEIELVAALKDGRICIEGDRAAVLRLFESSLAR